MVPPCLVCKNIRLVDAWRICELHRSAFGESVSLLKTTEKILRAAVSLKVCRDRRMIGYLIVDVAPQLRQTWINVVAVHPEFRRQGVARQLMLAAEATCLSPSIHLLVREDNTGAITLYRSLGYREVGTNPEYYRGRNGIEMAKDRCLAV